MALFLAKIIELIDCVVFGGMLGYSFVAAVLYSSAWQTTTIKMFGRVVALTTEYFVDVGHILS